MNKLGMIVIVMGAVLGGCGGSQKGSAKDACGDAAANVGEIFKREVASATSVSVTSGIAIAAKFIQGVRKTTGSARMNSTKRAPSRRSRRILRGSSGSMIAWVRCGRGWSRIS